MFLQLGDKIINSEHIRYMYRENDTTICIWMTEDELIVFDEPSYEINLFLNRLKEAR